jgi:hypothetical protein
VSIPKIEWETGVFQYILRQQLMASLKAQQLAIGPFIQPAQRWQHHRPYKGYHRIKSSSSSQRGQRPTSSPPPANMGITSDTYLSALIRCIQVERANI